MSIMISEIYDALKDAGASEEKSRKAAEVLANYDQKFQQIYLRLIEIKGEFLDLKWMNGLMLGGLVALIVKTFF